MEAEGGYRVKGRGGTWERRVKGELAKEILIGNSIMKPNTVYAY